MKNLIYFEIKKIKKIKKINNLLFFFSKILIAIYFFIFIFIFTNKTKSFKELVLKSGRKYLNKCLKGLINKRIKIEISEKPKISVIIPIYNSHKTIKSAITSIQNQNMIYIEIILIDDNSKDNSLKIIENIKKKDPRIKIINNRINMGILYSRCIGVLNSKGKYILNLDHDDMFFDEDVFNKLYQTAEKGNFDIVSFMEVQGNDYYISPKYMEDGICTYHHPDGHIVHQPELSYYTLFKNESFSFVDIQIWGKLFRTKIYKKAINLLGKERYSIFNTINEDMIGLYAICRVAKTYIYIRKYGLFHFISSSTASNIVTKNHQMNMEIFLIDVVFDLSINNNKKYAAILAIRLKTMSYYQLLNTKGKQYLFSVLKKIMNCKFIEEKYKKELILLYTDFKLLQ